MSERQDAALLLFGVAHYREIASKLRVVARGCNFPNVRKDLIDLAARYDRRADHFDRPREADGRLGVLSMKFRGCMERSPGSRSAQDCVGIRLSDYAA